MTIILNGNNMEIPEGSSLYDLIIIKKWRHVRLHVRIDCKDIPDSQYSKTLLTEGSSVRIIPQFGGG